MSDDLVTRLRARPYSNPSYWMLEAADEIERNRATMETQATLISDMRAEIGQLKVELVAARESLRLAEAEIEQLKAIINAKLHQRRCPDCGQLEWTSKNIRTCDECYRKFVERLKEVK